jgi:hypothetical protein
VATYRGQDGSVTFNAVSIGEVRSWTLNGSEIELIEDTVKGDTTKTYKGGLVESGTATVVCWLDYVTGQQDVIDYVIAGTDTAYSLVLLVESGKSFTGNALCQSYSVTSPEGSSVVEVTLNFKYTAAISVAWA